MLPQDPDWGDLAGHFTLMPGTRQIFDIAVESLQSTCGWGVPFMTREGERETLKKAHRQSDPAQWEARMASRTRSIDGLPIRATDRLIAGEDS